MAAVAEDLIDRGVTSAEHLGVRGGSNGGLLTGVMLTQRPDLWGAVVVQVPLLDMKRFNHLLAGASWMDEYGDPDTKDWEYIKEYSPYHNIDADAEYPKAFFTTSTRDDRVHPAHARKMVARMKEMGHDRYYYENTVGGHAGASDNTQAARLQSLIYSYLWDQLGTE
jgi:prolyl oligopeptidase